MSGVYAILGIIAVTCSVLGLAMAHAFEAPR